MDPEEAFGSFSISNQIAIMDLRRDEDGEQNQNMLYHVCKNKKRDSV
jgi:hypothetical protein